MDVLKVGLLSVFKNKKKGACTFVANSLQDSNWKSCWGMLMTVSFSSRSRALRIINIHAWASRWSWTVGFQYCILRCGNKVWQWATLENAFDIPLRTQIRFSVKLCLAGRPEKHRGEVKKYPNFAQRSGGSSAACESGETFRDPFLRYFLVFVWLRLIGENLRSVVELKISKSPEKSILMFTVFLAKIV